MNELPDLPRVLACAKALVARAGAHGLSDQAFAAKIDEILFGPKAAWACAREGLITHDETANLLLAHLDTLVERSCGKGFHHEASAGEDTAAMARALFG